MIITKHTIELESDEERQLIYDAVCLAISQRYTILHLNKLVDYKNFPTENEVTKQYHDFCRMAAEMQDAFPDLFD